MKSFWKEKSITVLKRLLYIQPHESFGAWNAIGFSGCSPGLINPSIHHDRKIYQEPGTTKNFHHI